MPAELLLPEEGLSGFEERCGALASEKEFPLLITRATKYEPDTDRRRRPVLKTNDGSIMEGMQACYQALQKL
ncbi:MAG: hypothetical protein Q7K33_00240 [Candidatus Berkelbacteria bacterium]|nr:hypothetical protein [Candidatus Berkelbacteria bacterium]